MKMLVENRYHCFVIAGAFAIAVLMMFPLYTQPASAQEVWHKEGVVFYYGCGVYNGFVHREESLYRMWFSYTPDCGGNAIGYAESSDGVTWEPYTGNPVLRGSGPWEGDTHTPTVIFDDGLFKMWYTGFTGQNKVGYATSTDGKSWSRHSSPVLGPTSGSWDSLDAGWPYVIKDGFTYKMWYAGSTDRRTFNIGYATSTDGINWIKYGGYPVLQTGPPGSFDSKRVHYPTVSKENGGTYRMWFEAYDGFKESIGYAVSFDGISWTKIGKVLERGPPGSTDSNWIGQPKVMLEEEGVYRMYYGGGVLGGHPHLHLATSVGVLYATVDCDPDTLNLDSKGKWITCYIELPQGHDPRNINASTILLNDVIPPELDESYGLVKSESSYIMDHDGDGNEERMVKFDRSQVQSILEVGNSVELTITGMLFDGTAFEGSDSIRVIE